MWLSEVALRVAFIVKREISHSLRHKPLVSPVFGRNPKISMTYLIFHRDTTISSSTIFSNINTSEDRRQGMSSATAGEIRSLYRSLLRQANQFAAYNFREYAKRRTRDAFREHVERRMSGEYRSWCRRDWKSCKWWRWVNTMEIWWAFLMFGLQRQTVVSQFFQLDRLVVEGGKTGKQKGDRGDIVRTRDMA
jgi:LYR motif-containing protein 4